MLRTILLTATLICGVAITTQAQFQLGIKGGLNLAKFDIEHLSTATKTGYHFGAYTGYRFGKVGIQPEIIFSQQGTNFEFDGADLESNFSYINVPILLKVYLLGGLNLQVGPQFGYLTSAKSNYNPIDHISDGDNVKEIYKNSDVSLAMGIGLDLPINVNLDFRYNYGLSDIAPENSAMTNNQVYQLSVGIRIID